MTDYEKRNNEVCALNCYFEDDGIFIDFLNGIEILGGKEENYYSTFKSILKRIVHHNAGSQVKYIPNDGEKELCFPTVGGMNINVIFKEETSEDPTKSKLYKILKIEVYENGTLKKWPLKRYSSKK